MAEGFEALKEEYLRQMRETYAARPGAAAAPPEGAAPPERDSSLSRKKALHHFMLFLNAMGKIID